MSNSNSRKPYTGAEQNLVISIDFGTTFSGTSWALLVPHNVPKIHNVSGFECQEHEPSSTKLPTVIFYDRQGNLKAVGNETLDEDIENQARKEDWFRVRWFKLLLRPRDRHYELANAPTPELPPNKTRTEVIGDFFRHMSGLSHRHFLEKVPDSDEIWPKVKDRIIYILSHPNGWNTWQHAEMRNAAISGGLIDSLDESERIHFVSEGEASLHWCLSDQGLARGELKSDSKLVVVDAGGGTIDVSSYEVSSLRPLQFREVTASSSHLAGSVLVTQAFKRFAKEKLESSSYARRENIRRLVKEFDQKVKCTFRRNDRKSGVPFASADVNASEYDIDSGLLMIEGTDMADFFEPSCAAAVAAIRAHVTPGDNTNVMLVGGFAASPWLYSEIQRRLRNLGIKFHRADGGTAKAAAHGAVSFYLDHLVSARVVRWTHGVSASVQFDPTDPKHFMRLNKVYTDPLTGEDYIPKGFAVLLNKGTLVDEKKPHRIPLRRKSLLHKNIELELEIRCYQGDEPNIEFLDEDDKDMFYEACMVKATIPKECLVRHARHAGPPPPFLPSHYWTCTFAVVASFGATEFQCYIEWRDQQGTLQRGPATSLWVEA